MGSLFTSEKQGEKKKKLTRQLDVHNAERVNNITDLVKNGKTPSRVFGTFKRLFIVCLFVNNQDHKSTRNLR